MIKHTLLIREGQCRLKHLQRLPSRRAGLRHYFDNWQYLIAESKFQPVDFTTWKCVQKRVIKQVQECWLGFSSSNECKCWADVSQPYGLAAFLLSGSQNSSSILSLFLLVTLCSHTWPCIICECTCDCEYVDVHNKPLCVCTYTSLCIKLWFSLDSTTRSGTQACIELCFSIIFLSDKDGLWITGWPLNRALPLATYVWAPPHLVYIILFFSFLSLSHL
jgi:hypothetical protein